MKTLTRLSGISLFLLQPMFAQQSMAINYHGSNTLRLSEYDSQGPLSPYPFEGSMAYDEFALYLQDYRNAYDYNSAQITGVYAADDYRHPETGISAERINLTTQRGSANLPYKAQLGDYFAYYSQLTLQQSLKGGQLELQPQVGFGQHSIIVNVGEIESDWRRLNLGEDTVAGLSWLVDLDSLGSFVFNTVRTDREGFTNIGTLDQTQTVYSLAGEQRFIVGNQRISIETEIAHFSGDHGGVAGAQSGQDRADNAAVFEVRSAVLNGRWDYRLRADHFGQDYRPAGAIITADRRSLQLHGGYRFTGSQLRARAQRFKDNYETQNILTTETLGFNLSGAYIPGVSSALDIYRQTQEDEAGNTDQSILTGAWDISRPLRHNLYGRSSFFYQHLDDKSITNLDSRTRQLGLYLDYSFQWRGFSGLLSPGVVWRELREIPVESDELQPTLRFSLSRFDHRVELQYNNLIQDRMRIQNGIDVETTQWSASYHYRRGRHVFGAEIDRFRRDPDVGNDTKAYRASLFWTFHFDGQTATPPSAVGLSQRSSSEMNTIDVLTLPPGYSLAETQSTLTSHNFLQSEQQGSYRAYHYPVFYDVVQGQSLVTEWREQQLEASGVVIAFDDRGDLNSMAQTYSQVLRQLIRNYGTPTRNFESGTFSGNLSSQLANGGFKRIVEWDMPKGVLRFGIPRRLDGTLRMELIYRKAQPETHQSLWGFTQFQ